MGEGKAGLSLSIGKGEEKPRHLPWGVGTDWRKDDETSLWIAIAVAILRAVVAVSSHPKRNGLKGEGSHEYHTVYLQSSEVKVRDLRRGTTAH